MYWYNVYSLRSPIEGKIIQRWVISKQKKSLYNSVLWVQSDEEDNVVYAIGGGFSIWRPQCEVQSGERVGQGQRCGFMLFGCYTEVLLPITVRCEVKVGDKVLSGSSVIAMLIHE
jgi:phosphatidylserine decarboxylase